MSAGTACHRGGLVEANGPHEIKIAGAFYWAVYFEMPGAASQCVESCFPGLKKNHAAAAWFRGPSSAGAATPFFRSNHFAQSGRSLRGHNTPLRMCKPKHSRANHISCEPACRQVRQASLAACQTVSKLYYCSINLGCNRNAGSSARFYNANFSHRVAPWLERTISPLRAATSNLFGGVGIEKSKHVIESHVRCKSCDVAL